MVMITRASGLGSGSEESGPSETDKHDWIEVEVSTIVRDMIPEMFRTIRIELIGLFDERCNTVASIVAVVATIDVVVITPFGKKEMPYQEFNNTKCPKFKGVRGQIVPMRSMSNVEASFYTCACPKNLKFKFAQNLLCLGAKD